MRIEHQIIPRYRSSLWVLLAVAALLVGPTLQRLPFPFSTKNKKKFLDTELDKPSQSQLTLEKTVSARFSVPSEEGWPGQKIMVDIRQLAPDYLYGRWLNMLQLFDQGWLATVIGHESTDYFAHQCKAYGPLVAKRKVAQFWRTYSSIKAYGFREPEKGRPLILLESKAALIRIDGAHRSVVLRHLGLKQVLAWVVEADELAGWCVETDDQRQAIQQFLHKGYSRKSEKLRVEGP